MKDYEILLTCFWMQRFVPCLCLTLVQLLRGVTIAAGGVLPNIHPELLSKKRGSKTKLEAIVTPPPPTQKSKTANKAAVKKLGTKKSSRVKVFKSY